MRPNSRRAALACAPGRWPSSATTSAAIRSATPSCWRRSLLAVGCGVATQYGMKHLIDVISGGPAAAGTRVWWAFALLAALIAADNLLWRVAGYRRRAHLRRGHRRHPQRPVRLPLRPFAELLRRASARRAGQPHQRHRQRRLRRGEQRRLERAAADPSRWCCAIGLIATVNPDDGRGAGRLRRGTGRADLPARPPRHAAAPRAMPEAPPGWMANWST